MLAVLIASAGWWVRWSSPEPKAYPDTFWYARSALQYAGDDATANHDAAVLTCDGMLNVGRPYLPKRQTYESCIAAREILPGTVSDRWARIFTSRPGYGLISAPLVRVAGPSGFTTTTALLSIASGVALGGLALAVGLGRIRALAAIGLYYWLPTGYWATRLHAEVPMLLFMILALTGGALLVRSVRGSPGGPAVPEATQRRVVRVGAGLVIAGLAGLLAVKSANAITTAATLCVAGAAVLLIRRIRWAKAIATAPRGGAEMLAALSAAAVLVHFALSALLGLPGLTETVQDTLTYHFSQPDVAHPWGPFFDEVWRMWRHKAAGLILDHPVQLLAFCVGVAGLILRWRRDLAILLLLLLTVATGPALATAHPYPSQFLRLTVVLWVPVALGIAALLPEIRDGKVAWNRAAQH